METVCGEYCCFIKGGTGARIGRKTAVRYRFAQGGAVTGRVTVCRSAWARYGFLPSDPFKRPGEKRKPHPCGREWPVTAVKTAGGFNLCISVRCDAPYVVKITKMWRFQSPYPYGVRHSNAIMNSSTRKRFNPRTL